MNMNANKLALSTAAAFVVLWIGCSLVVVLFPAGSMTLTGHMFHTDLQPMTWTLTWTGFFAGLSGWAILGGVTAWFVATIYNRIT